MKILLISDNHGDWQVVEDVLAKESHDFAIHLGDFEDPQGLGNFNAFARGNHDFVGELEQVIELEGFRILILHGHSIGLSVFNKDKPIIKAAKKYNADIVIHGHLHIPIIKTLNSILVLCPGSISLPRSIEGKTYMVLELIKGQKPVAEMRQF